MLTSVFVILCAGFPYLWQFTRYAHVSCLLLSSLLVYVITLNTTKQLALSSGKERLAVILLCLDYPVMLLGLSVMFWQASLCQYGMIDSSHGNC